jgi:DNA-binding transcriptional MerR regulator
MDALIRVNADREDRFSRRKPASAGGSYAITDLAREFSVTLRALRFYESKGLIKPLREGAARRYTEEDHRRLALILQGKRLGFTLVEIRDLLAAQKTGLGQSLQLSRGRCVEQIRQLERQKREIEEALAELRRNYTSLYTRDFDRQPVTL